MTIDEQELSRRLAETAAQVSAPQFTAAELGGRIRRRRARAVVVVAGAAVAVAAAAVAVPVALGGSGQAARPSGSRHSTIITAPPFVPQPGFSITVNGRAEPLRGSYAITPGERLTIVLDVIVPARKSLSAVWIGITNGILAPRRDGPADMSPILAARTRSPLGPGVHQFRLHWVAPRGLRAGDSRQLSVQFIWSEPRDYGLGDEGIVLELPVAGARA